MAADFDGSGRLSVFIANDGTPNFFYVNQTQERGSDARFVERAIISGLAFDQLGHSQACMGVAAGDADQDGLLDLFVTNFFDNWNTLYLQGSASTFSDATVHRGLAHASVRMLGFGTQFLDGEPDGWPDLIVTNGHIEDYTYKSLPFKMRPQYFHNRGSGYFDEVPRQAVRPPRTPLHFACQLRGDLKSL